MAETRTLRDRADDFLIHDEACGTFRDDGPGACDCIVAEIRAALDPAPPPAGEGRTPREVAAAVLAAIEPWLAPQARARLVGGLSRTDAVERAVAELLPSAPEARRALGESLPDIWKRVVPVRWVYDWLHEVQSDGALAALYGRQVEQGYAPTASAAPEAEGVSSSGDREREALTAEDAARWGIDEEMAREPWPRVRMVLAGIIGECDTVADRHLAELAEAADADRRTSPPSPSPTGGEAEGAREALIERICDAMCARGWTAGKILLLGDDLRAVLREHLPPAPEAREGDGDARGVLEALWREAENMQAAADRADQGPDERAAASRAGFRTCAVHFAEWAEAMLRLSPADRARAVAKITAAPPSAAPVEDGAREAWRLSVLCSRCRGHGATKADSTAGGTCPACRGLGFGGQTLETVERWLGERRDVRGVFERAHLLLDTVDVPRTTEPVTDDPSPIGLDTRVDLLVAEYIERAAPPAPPSVGDGTQEEGRRDAR